MLVSKFSAASAAAFLVAPCALAQTETRLPVVGVSTPRAGAQGYTLLATSTGPRTVTPAREPAASVVVIPNETQRATRAAAGGHDLLHVQPLHVRLVPVTPPSCAALFLANS